MTELFRALGALAEPPAPEHGRIAHALGLPPVPAPDVYTEVFTFQLYPFASVYLGPEGKMGGEARDRISGFWRALGHTPPSESDHLSVLLGLYASLAEAEEDEGDEAARLLWRQGRTTLLWEHLVSWLPAYLGRMRDIGQPFHEAWADVLEGALLDATLELGPSGAAGTVVHVGPAGPVGPAGHAGHAGHADYTGHGGYVPAHFREARDVPDPRAESLDAFLAGLLAPLRSGMILTRTDLGRCASELAVGLRVAERSYVLRSLLEADHSGVLSWLAGMARSAARKHAEAPDPWRPLGLFWQEQAEATATLLAELAEDV